MIVGVTGASSAIGGAVLHELASAGHEGVALGRAFGSSGRHFDLTEPVNDSTVIGLDAVIHLAWSWAEETDSGPSLNLNAGISLAAACARAGARPVLLSTFSTFAAASSRYGAAKLAVENRFAEVGGRSLRAGLIWGDRPAGMVATLAKLASFPLLRPRLVPDPVMHHSSGPALATALVSAATSYTMPTTSLAASREGVKLSALLDALRSPRGGLPAPVPVRLLAGVSAAAERIRLPLPFRSDSLAALALSAESGLETTTIQWSEGFPGTAALLDWATRR